MCGSGQDVVRITRGIGHELLMHHREQIRPAQALQHQLLVWRNGGGIAVVNHQGMNRRRHGRIGQRLAELNHIHFADTAILEMTHFRSTDVKSPIMQ